MPDRQKDWSRVCGSQVSPAIQGNTGYGECCLRCCLRHPLQLKQADHEDRAATSGISTVAIVRVRCSTLRLRQATLCPFRIAMTDLSTDTVALFDKLLEPSRRSDVDRKSTRLNSSH